MKPETSEHLAKARDYLGKARRLLDIVQYNDEAGPGAAVPLERVEAAITTAIRFFERVAELLVAGA